MADIVEERSWFEDGHVIIRDRCGSAWLIAPYRRFWVPWYGRRVATPWYRRRRAKWCVIRVAAADGQRVQKVLANHYAPVTMRIDTHPPAAEPEWELAVRDLTEADLRRVLGNLILVSKTVLGGPLEPA